MNDLKELAKKIISSAEAYDECQRHFGTNQNSSQRQASLQHMESVKELKNFYQ